MTPDEITHLVSEGAFPSRCEEPKLIETHISWVILCDEYVYKIKKPAHYSFLDFSSLEKRKYYCEREVMLNNRLTTGVYLGILPVSRADSSIGIGTRGGDVIDYAVHMRKLKGDTRMDILLRSDKVEDVQIRSLAQQVAAFHMTAATVYPRNVADVGDKFNDLMGEKEFLSGQLGEHTNKLITRAVERSEEFVEQNRDLLTERVHEGFTRDCHGDLHSRNIFLLEPPVIFDCIEFNDEYRQIDLLNEVAFLCMDLDAFGHTDLGAVFLHAYQERFPIMRNDQEEKLFNYYKSYRANVRAKVNSLRGRSAADEKARTSALKETSRYLSLMDRYLSRVA